MHLGLLLRRLWVVLRSLRQTAGCSGVFAANTNATPLSRPSTPSYRLSGTSIDVRTPCLDDKPCRPIGDLGWRAVFFTLSSWELWLVVFALVGGAAGLGVLIGRSLRRQGDTYREPFGALQGALLGVVGLILAFGLTLAVGRYENRRADVVTDANTIGTAYLRAQTIAEPQRSGSLTLLREYNDLAIRVTYEIPGSTALRATTAQQGLLQQRIWRLAGEAMNARPRDSAPRLYLDSLNAMIDQQGVRLAGLNNRVPNAVLWLELLGAAVALGLLGLYLAVLGRGLVPIVAAAVVVSLLILVIFDLDRPTRGLIKVPATPLIAEKAAMSLPPAAPAPGR